VPNQVSQEVGIIAVLESPIYGDEKPVSEKTTSQDMDSRGQNSLNLGEGRRFFWNAHLSEELEAISTSKALRLQPLRQ